MANYNTISELFTAIADIIRAKKNTTDKIAATDFPEYIDEIAKYRNLLDIIDGNISELPIEYLKELTCIRPYAFANCKKLIEITIPANITTIGESAFTNSGIINLIILGKTKVEQYGCMNMPELTNLTINNSDIGNNSSAFASCPKLTTITIKTTIAPNIRNFAFRRCTSLKDIYYDGTVSTWQSGSFGTEWDENTGNYTIHCADGDITKDGTITYHNT